MESIMFKELSFSFPFESLLTTGWMIASVVAASMSFSAFANAQSELSQIAQASNQFALDLHKKLAKEEGNLFYSPASISAALGMTYAGAEKETRRQMADVLHIPGEREAWMESNKKAVSLFNHKVEGYEVRMANRLWGQKDFAFQPNYLELTENVWNAPLGQVDFIHQPEPARKLINQWVEAQTNDRIRDLLPAGVINSDTRLVLTNAIYFKADWDEEFNKNSTKDAPFFVNEKDSKKVPLMFQKHRFNYYENDQIQLLSLPYKAGETTMEIILPRNKAGLKEIEESLSLEQLAQWGESARNRGVEVYLPRFKMTTSFQLKSVLSEMGMARAFSNEAEFGGITSEQELQISEVIHKAFVEVDEKGTEAAAATGVIMATRMAVPQERVVFLADHPFLFMIRHQPSGLILFSGRLSDPQMD
jgi:serpin B